MWFIFQIIGLFRQKRELYFWLGPKLYDANWLELCPVCWSVMSNECKVDVKVPIFPKMGGRTSKINVWASHAIRNSHILSSMFDQILKSVFHCSTVFPELQKITAFFRTLHNALIPTKRLPLSGGNEISTNELIRFLRCDVKRFLDTLSEKQYGNQCWCIDGCHFGNRIRLSIDNAWNDIFLQVLRVYPLRSQRIRYHYCHLHQVFGQNLPLHFLAFHQRIQHCNEGDILEWQDFPTILGSHLDTLIPENIDYASTQVWLSQN